MAIIKVDYGEVGGGVDMSPLFGKTVVDKVEMYQSQKRAVCPTLGINTVKISGITASVSVYGYKGDTETLIGSYSSNPSNVTVTGYDRISCAAASLMYLTAEYVD